MERLEETTCAGLSNRTGGIDAQLALQRVMSRSFVGEEAGALSTCLQG